MITEDIAHIVDYLIYKSRYLKDISLYHGKLGVSLALYMYADKNRQPILQELAWDLLQDVLLGISSNFPIGIENGLAGIGYGITLLKQKGFIDCDLDDELSEIDQKIMEYDPRRMEDISYRKGIEGILAYFSLRYQVEGKLYSIDGTFQYELKTLYDALKVEHQYRVSLFDNIAKPEFSISKYIAKPLGIDKGCSYYIIQACK